jgi:hypothetical protein
VSDLERRGLRFRRFAIDVVGPDAPADVQWNQRDLAHVAFVHGDFDFSPAVVDDERAAGIYLQRVLGIRVPMVVSFEQITPSARLYYSALGPFVLVIESELSEAPDGGAREHTTYRVGAPAWLAFALAWVERLLRRNAARLQAEDAPLRARRRQLRAWGYRFVAASDGGSYRASLDLARKNVLAPPCAPAPIEVALDDGAAEWQIGRDDHLGLRIVRDGALLSVYPRMCAHEGASLDGCAVRGGAVVCPWHGRRVAPLATFGAGGATEERRTEHHRLRLEGARLCIDGGS